MPCAMTPAQTAHDIIATIPTADGSSGAVQIISVRTLSSLRTAIANAVDEEECIHRLMARLRVLAHENVIRCQVQADADAAVGGETHPRSEHALTNARELMAALDARLGITND